MNEIISVNEVIELKQLPIIAEQMSKLSEQIDNDVNNALSLVVNEDTVKSIKDVRAALTKDFKNIDKVVKDIIAKATKPVADFEASYKEKIVKKYKNADEVLHFRISEVDKIRTSLKVNEVQSYFDEICQVTGIDFVTLDMLGIRVILSGSVNNYKKQISEMMSRVADELGLIQEMEHSDEVLVEYKKTLILGNAVKTVRERHEAIAANIKRQEELEERKRLAEIAAQKQAEIIKAEAEQNVIEPAPQQVTEPLQPASALKEIVMIQFENKDGYYSGREYSYFTDIPLAVGEVVYVPTKTGQGKAVVKAVDISPADVGCDLSLLKTIVSKPEAKPEADVKPEPEEIKQDTEPKQDAEPEKDYPCLKFEVYAPIEDLIPLKAMLIEYKKMYPRAIIPGL